jgi:hypothetical protein
MQAIPAEVKWHKPRQAKMPIAMLHRLAVARDTVLFMERLLEIPWCIILPQVNQNLIVPLPFLSGAGRERFIHKVRTASLFLIKRFDTGTCSIAIHYKMRDLRTFHVQWLCELQSASQTRSGFPDHAKLNAQKRHEPQFNGTSSVRVARQAGEQARLV